jgi:Bacteroidetes VLRF1 release factor
MAEIRIVRPKPRAFALAKRRKRAEQSDDDESTIKDSSIRLPGVLWRRIISLADLNSLRSVASTCADWRRIVSQMQLELIVASQRFVVDYKPSRTPSFVSDSDSDSSGDDDNSDSDSEPSTDEEDTVAASSSNSQHDSQNNNDSQNCAKSMLSSSAESVQRNSVVGPTLRSQKGRRAERRRTKKNRGKRRAALNVRDGDVEIDAGECRRLSVHDVPDTWLDRAVVPRLALRAAGDDNLVPLLVDNGTLVSLCRGGWLHRAPRSCGGLLRAMRDSFSLVAVFVCHGGYFAGAVFDETGSLLVHRRFHRYVVRKKAGKRQSSQDKSKHARSIGATLRRHHEEKYRQQIRETVLEWADEIRDASAIYIGAPGPINRADFFFDESPVDEQDERVISVPISTNRPSLGECERVYFELSHLYIDSWMKEK